MSDNIDFDIGEFLVEASEPTLVPEGDQLFEILPTPSIGETVQGGKYLRVAAKPVEQPNSQIVSVFFTVLHSNPEATRIGKEQFSQLAKACGAKSGNGASLVGARFVAKVTHKPSRRDGSPEASLSKYRVAPPLGQQVAAQPKAQAVQWKKAIPLDDAEEG